MEVSWTLRGRSVNAAWTFGGRMVGAVTSGGRCDFNRRPCKQGAGAARAFGGRCVAAAWALRGRCVDAARAPRGRCADAAKNTPTEQHQKAHQPSSSKTHTNEAAAKNTPTEQQQEAQQPSSRKKLTDRATANSTTTEQQQQNTPTDLGSEGKARSGHAERVERERTDRGGEENGWGRGVGLPPIKSARGRWRRQLPEFNIGRHGFKTRNGFRSAVPCRSMRRWAIAAHPVAWALDLGPRGA